MSLISTKIQKVDMAHFFTQGLKLSISNLSTHPKSHKYANYHFLLNRLNEIPLNKTNYNIELNNIIEIAKFNNFPIANIYQLNN